MKAKLVIFDFADTIAYLGPSKENLIQKFVLDESGFLLDDASITNAYHYLNNSLFYSSVNITNAKDKEDFYKEFNRCLLGLLGVGHLVDFTLLYHFFKANKQHWHLKKETLEVLNALKTRGHTISLVSNFDASLDNLLEHLQVKALFDSIFISQYHGCEKPQPKFLSLPLEAHKVSPSEAYFIGDNYNLDFLPAHKLGMNAVLLDEGQRYKNIPLLTRINTLSEALTLLQ
jgi:FMN phosphatase YigB (HAD superfamily)